MQRLVPCLLALALGSGCLGRPPPPPPTDGGPGGWDDRTLPVLDSTDAFFNRAATGPSSSVVKFTITHFGQPLERRIRYYDSTFYALHDEWYWFTLVNGQPTPGDDFFEPVPGRFDSIDEVYSWAREQPSLPLDLRFVAGGERLYSPRFYEIALSDINRLYGAGTLIHFPARTEAPTRDAVWAIELEYSDNVSHEELVVFLEMTLSSTSPVIAEQLKWLVRSPAQEALAATMEAEQLTYHDRILRYADVTVAGQTEVYAEGLTAGRLLPVIPGEASLEDSRSDNILLLPLVPDYLPPAAGILTAVPQTPLAHINVLARNRGIPNAFLSGLFDDPNLDQLGRVRAPVALRAIAPDRLDVVALDAGDWATWRAISRPPELELEPVDLSEAPLTLDLETLALDDVDELRPLIGGKAAGFLALLAPGDVTTPEWPMAITARAYREHLTPFAATIEDAIDEGDFERSPQTRVLVLEGEQAYDARFPTDAGRTHKAEIMSEHPPGTPIGELIAGGGVTGHIRATPIAPATLAALDEALRAQFGAFATSQGLRFRSSSTVEDIEGFNGAGLYTSNTGFLDPGAGQQGIEEALKRTWASYWGTEAFEERELVGIDHLLGHMAVLVHARFDDPLERSNGVFTLTLLPEALPGHALLEVNAQVGDLSVTNPPPGSDALPEIDRVLLGDDDSVFIERVAPSSELPPQSVVLTDGQLIELMMSATAVAEAWRDEENADLLSAQRRRVIVLDFEYREMGVGWPALANGNQFGRRLIVKQARSLEPSIAGLPDHVTSHPLPRDLLARARRIERRECLGVDASLIVVEATTDPLLKPDLGYSDVPFTSFLTLEFNRALPALDREAGDRTSIVHLALENVEHPGLADGGPWAFAADIGELNQASARLQRIAVDQGQMHLTGLNGDTVSVALTGCDVELQYSSPEAFLARIFDELDSEE